MMTSIPVNRIAQKESNKLSKLPELINGKVIGQDEAVSKVVKAIQRNRAGLKDPKRPGGSFIFAGPSGVGKTELSRTLAQFLFGDADALITGYSQSYPSVVKPMLELIGLAPGSTRVATTNVMMTKRGPMFLSDTSININPSAEDLIKISQMTAGVVKMFGMEPVMAMISYSNFGSSKNQTATKVREAVAYLHKRHPNLIVDGELQSDFALNSEMLQDIFPFSKLAGKNNN